MKLVQKSRKHTYEDHKEIVSVGVLYHVKCNGILHGEHTHIMCAVMPFRLAPTKSLLLLLFIVWMRTAKRTTQSHCLPQILVQSYLIVLEIYGVLFFLEMFFQISRPCWWHRYRTVNACRRSGFGFFGFDLFISSNAAKSKQSDDKIGMVACFRYSTHR